MRAHQFIPEAAFGTNPQRTARPGSRPARGHAPVKEGVINMDALSAKAKEMLAKGMTEQQVIDQLIKEGIPARFAQQAVAGAHLEENGRASRALCTSSKPDADLGASNLASCKSQGLRARDGDKSHKLGKAAKSRVKVGGHKIKGHKYGGPLPDWS